MVFEEDFKVEIRLHDEYLKQGWCSALHISPLSPTGATYTNFPCTVEAYYAKYLESGTCDDACVSNFSENHETGNDTEPLQC